MTMRRWIAAVAIVASMLGLYVTIERRRERFQRLAVQLARESLLAKVDLLEAELVIVERRGERFRQLANELTRSILLARVDLLQWENDSGVCKITAPHGAFQHSGSQDLKKLRARLLTLEQLSEKYAFAARCPYLPVWPDLRQPE